MLGLGLGGSVLGLLGWALVLRPRWRRQAFRDAGRRMRARDLEIRDACADYVEGRSLHLFTMGQLVKLSGIRLVLPGELGGPELILDLAEMSVKKGTKREISASLVVFSPLPGGPTLRIQRCTGFMRSIVEGVLRLMAASLPADFTFDTGTGLDEDHMVGSQDPEAARAFLDVEACEVIRTATEAIEALSAGSVSTCLIRGPAGVTLVLQEPPAATLKDQGLRSLVAAVRPVVELFEARQGESGA